MLNTVVELNEKTRLKANESRKSGLMPCLTTILNCFALEHCAFKAKHLKVSYDMA